MNFLELENDWYLNCGRDYEETHNFFKSELGLDTQSYNKFLDKQANIQRLDEHPYFSEKEIDPSKEFDQDWNPWTIFQAAKDWIADKRYAGKTLNY